MPRLCYSDFAMNEPQKPRWPALLCAFFLLMLVPAGPVFAGAAQSEPKARIVNAVDESQLVELKGHVHPQVRTLRPAGIASYDLPMERMMLLLSSSPAQQNSLEQLLAGQQDPSSSNYHRWLTPREFGEQFGSTRQDIDTITTWLCGHGFQVNVVAEGRRFVEFSGTAAQVAEAFHTEINSYVIEGRQYWANAANPYIPAALAPVVKGIVSLHNFPRRAMHRAASQTSLPIVNATLTGQFTSSSGTHVLGPYDFATIYNVLPLWNAGTDGTAQAIAVIAQSNIDTGNVSDFQNLFGLPVKLPQIILNGPDPGIVSGDETESELDVQWAGAVAKGATILLVVSGSTSTADGVDLSAAYAVDKNLAPIVSLSYGDCEQDLSGATVQGEPANQFYGLLWQQAAAQGISVFVSAGDQGSAGCDSSTSTHATQGFAVNGLASTPYNVAVGGTEFNEGGDTTYWNSVSGAHLASANRYIPEVVWNESATSGILAGSGGVSTIYSRPLWQTGTGVPAQDPGSSGQPHRLLPDVSLTAGVWHDGYLVCLNRSCRAGSANIYGGTSVSAQAFAGLMAMVNQSNGSIQGNPNFHFYPLANIPGVYHDITSGTNAVPCAGASPNCSSTTAGVSGVMNGYGAGTGYDLATGWGSIDANAMVTNWPTVTLGKGTSTLAVTAGYGNAIVGSTVKVTAILSPLATGAVQFYDDGAPLGVSVNGDSVNVSGGKALFATSSLALGTHCITASYSGDAAFNFVAAGSSMPWTLQVVQQAAPAASLTPQFDLVTLAYAPGSALAFNVQLSSTAFGPAPTGTLNVLDGTTLLWTASASGGAGSVLTLNTVAKPFSLGTHSLQLTYSGDGNWAPVSSSIVTVTIANPDFTLTASPSVSLVRGGSAGVSISTSSIAGYSGSLRFSCSGLPAEASCAFSPASLTAGSATDLTIMTTAPSAASLHQDHRLRQGSWRASAVLVLGGALLFAGARRKRRYRLAALWLVLAGLLIAGAVCSSGGGSSDPGTPAGTYTVMVTASSGALTHSTAFTLTVN